MTPTELSRLRGICERAKTNGHTWLDFEKAFCRQPTTALALIDEVERLREAVGVLREGLKFYASGGLTPDSLEMDADKIPKVNVVNVTQMLAQGKGHLDIIAAGEVEHYKSGCRARSALAQADALLAEPKGDE